MISNDCKLEIILQLWTQERNLYSNWGGCQEDDDLINQTVDQRAARDTASRASKTTMEVAKLVMDKKSKGSVIHVRVILDNSFQIYLSWKIMFG